MSRVGSCLEMDYGRISIVTRYGRMTRDGRQEMDLSKWITGDR